MCIRIEFEFISQDHFSRMCIVFDEREVPEKRARCEYLFKFDGALNSSRMCMCIEFQIQVCVFCWDGIFRYIFGFQSPIFSLASCCFLLFSTIICAIW